MVIWRPVVGFEGMYEVSNAGNIRSVDRFVKHSRGGNRKCRSRLMSVHKGNSGYYFCILYKNGRYKHVQIHRAVAEAFVPNPEKKAQVNHINALKLDNRAENLEWCTPSENMRHAYKNGLIPLEKIGKSGSKNNSARKVEQYDPDTGDVIASFETMKEASESLGVSVSGICGVCAGYRHSCKGLHFRYA